MSEHDYINGQRQVWTELLSQAVRALGYENTREQAWIAEREAAIAMLRTICEAHGDNDWPDDLHLADIIEKHLGRHLGE